MLKNYHLRLATSHDIPHLKNLIQLSASNLSLGYYTLEEITALNKYVFGVDTNLIVDQTYFVIEDHNSIIACGGWSKKATLFGGDQFNDRENRQLNPQTEAAKIRAFFIHPNYARQGLATLLMNTCINAAKSSGFKKIELMSTLPGIEFYERNGFSRNPLIAHTLPNNMQVKFMPMSKQLV